MGGELCVYRKKRSVGISKGGMNLMCLSRNDNTESRCKKGNRIQTKTSANANRGLFSQNISNFTEWSLFFF